MAALPARRAPRPGARAVAVVLAGLALAGIVASASPAAAHARLVEVRPADGAQVDEAPQQVTLRFDEPVQAPGPAVRVYDDGGDRVDVDDLRAAPEVVGAVLDDDLDDGTYVMTYRVTSADGHPLRGASLFVVGDGEPDESLLSAVFAAQDDRAAAVAAVLVRWGAYLATLLAAGLALCGAALRSAAVLPGARRLARAAAVAAVLLAGAQVAAQASLVSGDGLRALLDLPALRDAARGPVGQSAVVRSLALLAMVLLLPGAAGPSLERPPAARMRAWRAAALAGLVAALSFALEGHTRTTGPAWVVWPADLMHLAAAAVWIGGLATLALALRGRRLHSDPVGSARTVAGVSGIAGWSVLALSVAGFALGWAEVRAPRALVSTPYGWTLVTKLVAIAPVAAAAAYNRRRLVPAVLAAGRPLPAGGAIDAADGVCVPATALRHPSRAVDTLRRSLRVELGGIAVVLGITAVLVGIQPAADAAGITGFYSTALPLGDGGSEVNLTVDPNRAGTNEIHIYVLGPDGRQVDVVESPVVSFELAAADIGPLEREPTRLGPGHFLVAGPELSVPGTWDVSVAVPLSRLEVPEVTVAVPVNP